MGERSQLEHWESVGRSYAAEWDPPARRQLGERELEFIASGLEMSPGRTALDVGVGNGRIIEGLLRRSTTTRFYGIDLAPAMVQATRERLADEPRLVELAVCDLARQELPFDQQFDFVSAIRMLKYNREWPDMVAKLVQRLTPGGVIVFSMENRRSLNALAREYAVSGHMATAAELRRLVHDLGLRSPALDGFTKLPHRVYSGVRSTTAARGLLALDAMLRRALGGPALAREIFVVASRD